MGLDKTSRSHMLRHLFIVVIVRHNPVHLLMLRSPGGTIAVALMFACLLASILGMPCGINTRMPSGDSIRMPCGMTRMPSGDYTSILWH